MTEVQLPAYFKLSTVHSFLAQIISEDGEALDSSFCFSLEPLRFIEPVGVTIFSNIIEWLTDNNVEWKIDCRPNPGNGQVISFLNDSKFFRRYDGSPQHDSASCRPTTMPLRVLSHDWTVQYIEDLTCWLAGRLQTRRNFQTIKSSLGEVFNNINDHSGTQACVFAQHYPMNDEVKIAISDFGQGIPSALRSFCPGMCDLSDERVIVEATEQGVSSKSTPGNRGAGLHNILNYVVKMNQGRVEIVSAYGKMTAFMSSDGTALRRPAPVDRRYPGTILHMVFRTDTLPTDTDDEDLEW